MPTEEEIRELFAVHTSEFAASERLLGDDAPLLAVDDVRDVDGGDVELLRNRPAGLGERKVLDHDNVLGSQTLSVALAMCQWQQRLQVVGVHAQRVLASMVHVVTAWDRAVPLFVVVPMRQMGHTIPHELAVSVAGGTSPIPTAGRGVNVNDGLTPVVVVDKSSRLTRNIANATIRRGRYGRLFAASAHAEAGGIEGSNRGTLGGHLRLQSWVSRPRLLAQRGGIPLSQLYAIGA